MFLKWRRGNKAQRALEFQCQSKHISVSISKGFLYMYKHYQVADDFDGFKITSDFGRFDKI